VIYWTQHFHWSLYLQ